MYASLIHAFSYLPYNIADNVINSVSPLVKSFIKCIRQVTHSWFTPPCPTFQATWWRRWRWQCTQSCAVTWRPCSSSLSACPTCSSAASTCLWQPAGTSSNAGTWESSSARCSHSSSTETRPCRSCLWSQLRSTGKNPLIGFFKIHRHLLSLHLWLYLLRHQILSASRYIKQRWDQGEKVCQMFAFVFYGNEADLALVYGRPPLRSTGKILLNLIYFKALSSLISGFSLRVSSSPSNFHCIFIEIRNYFNTRVS